MIKKVSRKFLRRAGKINKHHNLAKSRGGTKTGYNMFLMDDNRHAAFHLLFGTRTFQEAALVLLRADRMRKNFYKEVNYYEDTNARARGGEIGLQLH